MGSTRPPRTRWILERRWGRGTRPLPTRHVHGPEPAASPIPAFDFSTRIQNLCADIAVRCPELGHVDPSAVLFTFTPSRTRSRYGLQARVTPMRCRDGQLTRRFRGVLYQVQRYFVDGREMMYLVTFCLPRFLDQSFSEKMITVFHELFHISPRFDGDLRRHPGRYAVHSHSKREYDVQMAKLAERYLAEHPNPAMFGFLKWKSADLHRIHGAVRGVVVPRPKLVPVTTVLG